MLGGRCCFYVLRTTSILVNVMNIFIFYIRFGIPNHEDEVVPKEIFIAS